VGGKERAQRIISSIPQRNLVTSKMAMDVPLPYIAFCLRHAIITITVILSSHPHKSHLLSDGCVGIP
jgi:hypothetical protein